jgi:hypothetical protein
VKSAGLARHRGAVPAAATLACAPWIIALAGSGHSLGTVFHSTGIRTIVATDALVFEAVLVTVAAPLAGVSIASFRGPARATYRGLAATLGAFIGVSLLIGFAASRGGVLDPGVLLESRAALAATALALASVGALCATLFHNVLDAAGVSLLAVVLSAGGLLAAGPLTSSLPERAINAGLLASPLIAATSSARVDLLRSAELYHFSPIAHRRFEYPEWWVVSVSYLGVAGCCLTGMALKLCRDGPAGRLQ